MSQHTLAGFGTAQHDPYDLSGYDWSLSGVNTTPLTHGLHYYPARMIPQIPRQLINHWEETDIIEPGGVIYDPFCGSGTTVTEARLAGYQGVGTDINPFACLLARAKAEPIAPARIEAAARSIFNDWHVHRRFIHDGHSAGDPPEPTAVAKGWFPEPQVYELDSMARRLSEGRGDWSFEIVRFLRICLASIVREVSFQQNGEFKRQRIPESDRIDHNPDVWELFCEAVAKNVGRMERYCERASEQGSVDVRMADCRSPAEIETNSADAVICSPPYGDHSTTVAYGQYSRAPALAATPLKVEAMRDVDPTGLGGTRSGAFTDVDDVVTFSPALQNTLTELESVDGRSDDAFAFFADYFEAINQLARVVKEGQPVALVVGNRTMSRTPIPMHLITEDYLSATGFTLETTEPRTIPTKTLPWENAPENEAGNTGELMADEYIIVGTAPEHQISSEDFSETGREPLN